jgi:hypothetical protein
MIHVTHNGAEQELDPASCSSLGDVLSRITEVPGSCARVVVRLRVNAEEVPGDDLEAASARPLDGVSELEVESRTPVQVAEQSLEGAAEYAERVERTMHGAAAQLRQGEVVEGSELIAHLADALSVLLYTIRTATGLLGGAPTTLEQAEAELAPWLDELACAQEAGDWLRSADLLEFELAPLLEGWRDAIRARGTAEAPGA